MNAHAINAQRFLTIISELEEENRVYKEALERYADRTFSTGDGWKVAREALDKYKKPAIIEE